MALLYACSMDHYGTGTGTPTGPLSSGANWGTPTADFVGDGWSSDPALGNFSGGISCYPEGTIGLTTPSWGARSGDYALVADGFEVRGRSIYSSVLYQLTGIESYRLPIPGASATHRIFHVAFSCSALPAVDKVHGKIMHFMTAAGDVIFTLAVSPSGRLQFLSGLGDKFDHTGATVTAQSTSLASSASPEIAPNTWYSLNIDITSTTSGTTTHDIDVYINGSTAASRVISVTGIAGTVNGNIDMIGVLPASASGSTDVSDTTVRAIRDLAILDDTGSYANSVLGQAYISAQEFRAEDAGGGWTAYPRENITTGILDSHTTRTGLYAADSASLDIGASDFTAETLVRFDALPTGTDTADLISKWKTDTSDRSYRLYYDAASGEIRWDISTDGATTTGVIRFPWVPVLDHYYHVAISRTSGSTRLFINGVEFGVAQADANTYYASAAPLGVAGRFDATSIAAGSALDGWLDETRLTIGTGRYTADFTPPSAAFGRDVGSDANFADVVLLMGYQTGTIADESSYARAINVAGSSPLTAITPDDAAHTYSVLNQRPSWDDTFIEAENLYAEGVLTLTAVPTAAETVTIGSITYTWVSSLTAANDVLIGASTLDSINNLVAAVNAGPGAGTVYGTGTTANTAAVASLLLDPQMSLRAVTIGAAGNSVATTETMTAGSFKNTTLTGGADIPADSDFSLERLPTDVTGVVAVQVSARAYKTDAGTSQLQFDLIGPSGGVGSGTGLSPDLNPAWYRQIFHQDPDTAAGLTPSTLIGGRIRVKRTS